MQQGLQIPGRECKDAGSVSPVRQQLEARAFARIQNVKMSNFRRPILMPLEPGPHYTSESRKAMPFKPQEPDIYLPSHCLRRSCMGPNGPARGAWHVP